jgi:hypothetical protein
MSKGGRPALDILGQELRRGAEDYGTLDGTEFVAVFSARGAPGRPREGRMALSDLVITEGGPIDPPPIEPDPGGDVVVTGGTFATLPTPALGMLAYVTDGMSTTPGMSQAGGGSSTTLVWYNGTRWLVLGA